MTDIDKLGTDRSPVELEALLFHGFFALYDRALPEEKMYEDAANIVRVELSDGVLYRYDYLKKPDGREVFQEYSLQTLLEHCAISMENWSWVDTYGGGGDLKNVSPDVNEETLALIHYCDSIKDRSKEIALLHILTFKHGITLAMDEEGTGFVWTDQAGAEICSSNHGKKGSYVS